MPGPERPRAVGRAAQSDPPNRFVATHCHADDEHRAEDAEEPASRRVVPTELLTDRSRSIITENNSPDIPFRYGVNAYRGCEHGCSYCYARPYHEYLGMSAGLDFETKILVKYDAPDLLRAELTRSGWKGDLLAMSGVTDCYQPAERELQLTRRMLEVMLEARQCVAIITKNALVLRDLDLLAAMARLRLVQVNISITTLDASLARTMEPRTSPPPARFEAIRSLAAAGVPTRALVAPVIPGLTDHEMPALLAAAADAGAEGAYYQLLRLPLTVEKVFREWLAANYPAKQQRVESLIRATRGGRLSDSRFGRRMRGEGNYAEQIRRTFQVFARKRRLDGKPTELDTGQFRPPRAPSGQMRLF